jgi:hypothetical protein
MNITKALMIAAVTALTLGTGAAMAQSEVPSAPEAVYFSGQRHAAPRTINHGSGQVQSGSSDVNTPRSQNPYDVTSHPELDRSIGDSGG